MELGFRVDLDYQYLHSRRHDHPRFVWDGHLECQGGQIESCWLLSCPVIWYGPGHCPKGNLVRIFLTQKEPQINLLSLPQTEHSMTHLFEA